MQTRHKLEIEALAQATPNVEICGMALLKHDQTVVLQHCQNVADKPDEDFDISQDDHINAARTGRILWVYHSHPHLPAAFSEADIESANENGHLQWLYNVVTKTWREYIPPSHFVPLEGRPFIWGEQDCLTLMRDYYRQTFQIYLNDYDRDETSDSPALGRLVMKHLEGEGFKVLPVGTPIQKHDTLILRTNGVPQHFGIFTGNSVVLHHPLGALSRKDQYSTAWQRRLHCVARYSKRSLA